MPQSLRTKSSVSSFGLPATVVYCAIIILAPIASAQAKERPILTREELEATRPKSPNPYLAFLPLGVEPDFRYWKAKARFDAEDRRAAMGIPTSLINVAESEPNDSMGTADPIPGFGTGAGEDSSTSLTGTITPATPPTPLVQDAEDDGQISFATDTGLTLGSSVVVIGGTIGDGPHGSGASGSGDYDFFKIDATAAGQIIMADADTTVPFGDLDPFIALYDSTGTLIGFNDDDGSSWDSLLNLSVPAAGSYYLAISGYVGFNSLIGDPNDSSSGPGAGSEGVYDLTLSLGVVGDVDYFAVDLHAGDVLGVSLTGLSGQVSVYEPSGENRMGSSQDVSFIYPSESTLPSGLASATLVAAETGTHYIGIDGGGSNGAYSAVVEASRPITETAGRQILFVDFSGPTVDPSTWGAPPGAVAVSPLSAFLAGWGLTPGDEDAVIDSILATISENLVSDLRASGGNANFDVEIRNSRDHADPFGQTNVSRLIVGGTIAETGLQTIGIAESIDPGNFGLEEDAIILLDLLSAAASDPNSLNQYGLAGGATKIDLIGQGVGNITAHEAGHYLGSFHTEQFVTAPNIMDQGGNLANTVGVGPDEDLGTGDDVDVDFIIDMFVPSEGFLGEEDTRSLTAFGLSGGSLFADGFESGDVTSWSGSSP